MPARAHPTTYAVLLRGVNLGARNKLSMPDLRALVEELGCEDVQTYVQSGNVVLSSDRSPTALTAAIERGVRDTLGLEIPVLVRTGRQLRRLVDRNPFSGPKVDPKTLHVTFLFGKPDPAGVRRLREGSFEPERFQIVGEEVYLSCPNGYGRAKLGNAVLERHLGVPATTRNWRTVTTLAELAIRG